MKTAGCSIGLAIMCLALAGCPLTVTIQPPGVAAAGAQWRVDGGAWMNSGASVSQLSTGSHTVSFSAVTGWTKPNDIVVAINNSSAVNVTGTYTAITIGSLTVDIGPADVVRAGAQWRLDGGPYQNGGDTIAPVSAGAHTVSFKPVNGWTTPADQPVTVVGGQTASATGTYTVLGATGAVKVMINPAAALNAGAQWRLDGGDWHTSNFILAGLPAGHHTVSFQVAAGWIKPLSQGVDIVAGQTASATGAYTAQLASSQYVVFGYNNLGMHCLNQDFSNFMILPPYNTLHAMVIRRGDDPHIVTSGVTIDYALPANTTSVTKTNFWTYAQALFGLASPLTPNIGLAGNGLSGSMTSLASSGRNDWNVLGIPVTPIEDDGSENPYTLATVTVKQNNTPIVQTQAVVPSSWEISCQLCHVAPGITTGLKILLDHDRLHGTTLVNQQPVACGKCHAQPELGFAGDPARHNLSRAVHGAHASRMATLGLDVACYACHPGVRTQCFRDVHFSAGMVCMDCHGEMTNVADPSRVPWETEPRCGTCHTRAGFEFEQANTLFRDSKGHHGVHCQACHGSPHAITPTVKPEDNMQAIALQGHAGTINTCTVCHTSVPDDTFDHRFGGGDK